RQIRSGNCARYPAPVPVRREPPPLPAPASRHSPALFSCPPCPFQFTALSIPAVETRLAASPFAAETGQAPSLHLMHARSQGKDRHIQGNQDSADKDRHDDQDQRLNQR